MEISENYKSYLTVPVKELPNEVIEYFVAVFMKEASINMGSVVERETTERTLYFIRGEYSYLPIQYVGTAFIKGSLGKYGAGRLIPRTIQAWLS